MMLVVCQPALLCSDWQTGCRHVPQHLQIAALLLDYLTMSAIASSSEVQGDHCKELHFRHLIGSAIMVIHAAGTTAVTASFLDCRQ